MIAYLALKDRNTKTAEHMLIFGAIWTIVGIITLTVLVGFLFGISGTFSTSSVRTFTVTGVVHE